MTWHNFFPTNRVPLTPWQHHHACCLSPYPIPVQDQAPHRLLTWLNLLAVHDQARISSCHGSTPRPPACCAPAGNSDHAPPAVPHPGLASLAVLFPAAALATPGAPRPCLAAALATSA